MLDDPKEVKESRTRAKLRQAALDDFTKRVMSTPQGRSWVNNFLEQFQIFQSPFAPDPITMAHNVGMQNFGRKLLSDLMALTPTEFITMLKEANDERSADLNRHAQPDLFDDGNAGDE